MPTEKKEKKKKEGELEGGLRGQCVIVLCWAVSTDCMSLRPTIVYFPAPTYVSLQPLIYLFCICRICKPWFYFTWLSFGMGWVEISCNFSGLGNQKA